MDTLRIMGLFAVIPTTILLTVSFFVLFALRKIETQGLKTFGYVIAVFLWLSAALVFSAGIYTLATGNHPILSIMREKSRYHSPHWMDKGQMPGMMEPECLMMQGKHPMMMEEKMSGMMQKEADKPVEK